MNNELNIKEFLSNKKNLKPLYACVDEKSKYFSIRQYIFEQTAFLPEDTPLKHRILYIQNDIHERKKCKCGCGEYITSLKKDYLRGHSNRSEDVKQKKIDKCIEKYGVINPSQIQTVKEKKKNTFIKKYNSSCYFTSDEGKENTKQKLLNKYGVDNYFKTNESRNSVKRRWEDNKKIYIEKISETNLDVGYEKITKRLESDFTPLFERSDYMGVGKRDYLFECNKCRGICRSNLDNGNSPRCYKCNPPINDKGFSVIEEELHSFLFSLFDDIVLRDRSIIYPLELDAYISTKGIAFELDGLYWHSENNGKGKHYHINKTDLCKNRGVRLIHIFEDEWKQKQNIVKNRIRHILGKTKYNIYARKCTIKEIDKDIKNKFLQKYHIQGPDKSLICLGAFYKNRLVSVMTFGKLRKALGHTSKDNFYELIRFCSVGSFNITGIASKLLSHFEKNYNPHAIYSYADMRWSNGGVYTKMNFEYLHTSPPNYWYMKDYNTRLHRFGFQKHILRRKLNVYDEKLSEWTNMKNNGYDRIWDCGAMVFVKKIKVDC